MIWFKLWQARIGYEITEDEIEIWEQEIEHDTKGATSQEVLDAVRTVADRKRMGHIPFKPGLDDLIEAIKATRKSDAGAPHRSAGRISALKAAVKAAMPDNVKAWSAICNHDAIHEMQAVEAWASRELGFARPTWQEIGIDALEDLAGGFNGRVTDDVK